MSLFPHLPKGLALLLLTLLAQLATAAPLPSTPGFDLAGSASFLEDRSATLTLHEVMAIGEGWQPTPATNFNRGFSSSAWWLRVELANTDAGPQQRLLEVGYAMLDFIDLYAVADGQIVAEYRTGDARPFGSRPLNTRFFVFPVRWEPEQPLTLYLRVQSSSAVQVPLSLWQPDRYAEHEVSGSTAHGLYVGAMGAIILYNLLLFTVLRERAYLFYIAFVSSITLFFVGLSGQGYHYLWPDSVEWNSRVVAVALSATVLFGSLFTRAFLGLRALSRTADNIVSSIALMGGLMLLLAWIVPYRDIIGVLVLLCLVSCLADISAGLLALSRRQAAARVYLLAWGVFLLGSIILALSKTGALPSNLFTDHANQLGSVLEAVLFSFALAQRINAERRLRLAAQEATLAAQRRLTEELEHRVAARTAELAELNQQLQELSDTDPLTGLRNRRYLEAGGNREWRHCARYRHPLAVLLLDVDHFKQVNDRFGHAAGDACLRAVARRLEVCVRHPSDVVARYGGEEFCMVLPETDASGAVVVAERIRQLIAAEPVQHEGAAIPLTISIGVCSMQPGADNTLEQALRHADRALYLAKSSGRDRVSLYGSGSSATVG
jgi:diguanylate cyclase (GGDEF)-like protein